MCYQCLFKNFYVHPLKTMAKINRAAIKTDLMIYHPKLSESLLKIKSSNALIPPSMTVPFLIVLKKTFERFALFFDEDDNKPSDYYR